MIKKVLYGILVIIMVSSLTGCVSDKKYSELEKQLANLEKQLGQDDGDNTQQNADVNKDKAEKNNNNDSGTNALDVFLYHLNDISGGSNDFVYSSVLRMKKQNGFMRFLCVPKNVKINRMAY